MDRHRVALLMAGPVLLFFAVFLIPGGNIDPEARIGFIKMYLWNWWIGHSLMMLAVPFLLIWLADVTTASLEGLPGVAFVGSMLVLFALLGDFGRTIFQLFAVEQYMLKGADVQATLELFNSSWLLVGLVYLSTLMHVPGFVFLAASLFKAGRSKKQLFLLGSTGLFLTGATLAQVQFLQWTGAFLLLVFTWLHVNMPLEEEE